MKVKLLKDIVSNGKKKVCYGEAGEILKVLLQNGEVFILKGKKENFPVKKN